MAILDVRSATEYGICSLPGSIRASFRLRGCADRADADLAALLRDPSTVAAQLAPNTSTLTVVCRRGNDSLVAARTLRALPALANVRICDLDGGLAAWAREADPSFPVY